MAQMSAIQTLKSAGHFLLRSVADPRARVDGVYRVCVDVGKHLNEEQVLALNSLRHGVEVIQGPPGTGKTTLIFEILSKRLPADASVLVTSNSRQAIDNLVEKIASAESGQPLGVVVLGNIERFLKDEPVKRKDKSPAVEFEFLHKFHLKTQVENDPDVARLRAEHDGLLRQRDAIIDMFAQTPQMEDEADDAYFDRLNLLRARRRLTFAVAGLNSIAPDLCEKICSDGLVADLTPQSFKLLVRNLDETTKALEGARVDAEEAILKGCRVLVSTIGSLHHVAKHAASKNLTTIIVDEASRLSEMDVPRLLAVSPELKNLILFGDQQQLQVFSNSQSKAAASSLMARFTQLLDDYHMLKEQHRMDPQICHLVSQLGYNNQLRTNAEVASSRKQQRISGEPPVQFHECHGEESKSSGGTSFSNDDEAQLAVDLYHKERQYDEEASIMIIAFYKAQVDLIRRLLPDNDPKLKVCSVDSAQGSESSVVILSPVRSTKITRFGEDEHRVTVAFSRAQNRLHVLGCRTALEKSSRWRWVINMVPSVNGMRLRKARCTAFGSGCVYSEP